MVIPTIYLQYICKIADLKFERSDNLPAVHLQVITPCKGTATITNINTDKGGKAVDFMRQVRKELSELYQSDQESYHKELKKTMADFLSTRTKTAAN